MRTLELPVDNAKRIERISDEVFLKRWMIIGLFDSIESVNGFPVDFVDPITLYHNELRWTDERSSRLSFQPNQSGGWYFAANYAYARKDEKAGIITKTDMSVEWFVNGKSVLNENSGSYIHNEINLKHGWNLLVCCLRAESFLDNYFSAGILDRRQQQWRSMFVKNCFMLPDNFDSHLFGKNPEETTAIQIGDIKTDWRRSKPDYAVYIPKEGDIHNDGDNEHFLVVQSPKSGDLLAFWTQGLVEPSKDNHFMLSRSKDSGESWSEPIRLAGTTMGGSEPQASWGFPVVSKSGKIYALYTKAPAGTPNGVPGVLGTLVSDDDGINWESGPAYFLPPKINKNYDKDTSCSFIVWQLPIRDSKGRVIVGMTCWQNGYGKCYLIRFDNIDEDPCLSDIKITWLPDDGEGVGMPQYLKNRECSEPAIVLLPDKRLFMTMRTATGHIWYSVSDDDGHSWREPEVLRYKDCGQKINHPLSCCPIYSLKDGRYILLHNNNKYYADRLYNGLSIPPGMGIFTHRRPAYISAGKFMPAAHQPIWFDEPVEILDTDGVHISAKGSNEIGTYPSLTEIDGDIVLWYPDRKYYLLGKKLNDLI